MTTQAMVVTISICAIFGFLFWKLFAEYNYNLVSKTYSSARKLGLTEALKERVGANAIAQDVFGFRMARDVLGFRTRRAYVRVLEEFAAKNISDAAAAEREYRKVAESRHKIVELTRYVIESVAVSKRKDDPESSRDLEVLGQVLPYLLSGCRHWDEYYADDETLAGYKREAALLAHRHGFTLSDDPHDSVSGLLNLAMMLIDPSHSLPVERLRACFPADKSNLENVQQELFTPVQRAGS